MLLKHMLVVAAVSYSHLVAYFTNTLLSIFRLSRQLSVETPSNRITASKISGKTSSTSGSTKSLNTVESCSPTVTPQGSPRSWERHYGCWKARMRHPSSSSPGTSQFGSGPSSAPGSPILYRATKCQRSESVLSLPGGQDSDYATASSSSSTASRYGGNNEDKLVLVASTSQSCPNSPRRMPKKFTPGMQLSSGRAATPINIVTSGRGGISGSNSRLDIHGSPHRRLDQSRLQGTSSIRESPQGPSDWGSSSPQSSPSRRYLSSNAQQSSSMRTAASIVTGTTRWVMKRSAYRYDADDNR